MKKVILISIDGMRPDGLMKCNNTFVDDLLKMTSHTLEAKTVFPSVTLPCHLSMFYSIPPQRHGTLSNEFVVPVRPINGLLEELKENKKRSSMYYGWEPLRAVGRPGSLVASEYIWAYSFDNTDGMLTDRALDYIKLASPDFVFLYMVETDEKGGHDAGWMSETYLEYISRAIDNVKRVIDEVGDEYSVIITADHGGHDRCHGTELDEDMIIPMMFYGPEFEKGKKLQNVSILDIAPTVADIMGIDIPREWEGKSLIS